MLLCLKDVFVGKCCCWWLLLGDVVVGRCCCQEMLLLKDVVVERCCCWEMLLLGDARHRLKRRFIAARKHHSCTMPHVMLCAMH